MATASSMTATTEAESLDEKQNRLVEAALASGRWISTQDSRGRTVYYNPRTKETTRDLRMQLLRHTGWEMLSQRNKEIKTDQARKERRDAAIVPEEDRLRQELTEAKALIEAYESEVTWLRLALLEAEGRLDPGELAVAETSRVFAMKKRAAAAASFGSGGAPMAPAEAAVAGGGAAASSALPNNSRTTSAGSHADSTGAATAAAAATGGGGEDGGGPLAMKLDEARRLNQRLLTRISTDRQQKHLCTRCLQDVELTAARAGDRENFLRDDKQPYSLTVPGGVGFPTTLSNPATFDAVMLSRGLDSMGAGNAAQIGYLPRPYDPMKASQRPYESPARRALAGAAAVTGGAGARAGGRGPGSPTSPARASAEDSDMARNLRALQSMRHSMEGEYAIDAHVRDPARNDFFRSPYFTASLKGRVAGSRSNELPGSAVPPPTAAVMPPAVGSPASVARSATASPARESNMVLYGGQQHQQSMRAGTPSQTQNAMNRKLKRGMPTSLYGGNLFTTG